MRPRWLWGDYIEPGVAMTPEERARVRARINANLGTLPNFWLVLVGLGVGGWVTLFTVAEPLGEWLKGPFPTLRSSDAHGISVVAVLVVWVLGSVLLLGRLYVPIGRRSMCECGVPVCLRCGYDLRGVEPIDGTNVVRCPECGGRQGSKGERLED